ncbi:MAG: Respiratory supercomplex factor 1, mitochondrial [Peltula sp. TS41687]|nr:MAG: Respiratory supercomplex factor 1, mitochondrial [Peltula sp. TS41687]
MSDAPLPSSFDGDEDFFEESRWQKFSRRLKEEPLIPLGCGLTCWALLGASRSIRAGTREQTNKMFRARIYAQGFTILAMVAGSYYYAEPRQRRKKFEGSLAEKKADEKKQAWIRELEARDVEDREIKARRDAARKRAAAATAATAATAAAVAATATPAEQAVPPTQDGDEDGQQTDQSVLRAVKELSGNG